MYGVMQSHMTQEDSSSPADLLPSAYNLRRLNKELKKSAGGELKFQPIKNGHALQLSERQITSP
jgi:hypothetical protein